MRKCRIGINNMFVFVVGRVGGIREWKSAKSELDKRDTKGPQVRFDRVWGALNPLRLCRVS